MENSKFLVHWVKSRNGFSMRKPFLWFVLSFLINEAATSPFCLVGTIINRHKNHHKCSTGTALIPCLTLFQAKLKDRLHDQRRGEWMGADKNSSPKRELGLCPKFTTKDPHMSLPKSRSHDGPTNPRRKPQTIPKPKRNSKNKGLSSSALDEADCPKPPGGPSARSRRTVRRHQADRPWGLGGLSTWLWRAVRK
jgi:hypothetical protein